MNNFPQVPNGLATTQLNVGVYLNKASVRHEQTQKEQLADIRAREAPPSPAALMTKEKYLQLGSGEKITEHRKRMAKTCEKINAASLGMKVLEKPSQTSPAVDTPPRSSSISPYSRPRRAASASMQKRAFYAGVLSLPTDDAPNMTRAMRTQMVRHYACGMNASLVTSMRNASAELNWFTACAIFGAERVATGRMGMAISGTPAFDSKNKRLP